MRSEVVAGAGSPGRCGSTSVWSLTALLILWGKIAFASPLAALERFEGEPVVAIEVLRPSDVALADVARLLGVEVGDVLDPDRLREAVDRLYQAGRFRNVVIRGRPGLRDGVVLEVVLEASRVLSALELEVGAGVDRGWLRSRLGVQTGDPIDVGDLPEMQDKLQDALERRGWRAPAIGLALEPLDDTGRTRLIVRVEPGPRTRLRRIRLRGWLPMPTWELDVGVGPGDVVQLGVVEEALEELRERLRGLGYLDVEIPPPEVVQLEGREDRPLADLVVEVNPGPRTEVLFAGHRRVAQRRLEEDVAILAELGTGAAALIEAKERILARYERLGYDRAKVEVAGRTSADGRRRQVLFRIREGRPRAVARVRFEGARAIAPQVLRGQVRETVERFLAPALGRPGVDPEVVDLVFRSEPGGLRRERPSTAPPDPDEVFVPRAYVAGTEAIADLYRSRGFQLVEVRAPRIERAGKGEVNVVYPIEEGVRWTVGSVAFSGHQGISGRALLEAADLTDPSEDNPPLAFEGVEAGRRAIVQLYRDRGYLFASVTEELRQVPERGRLGGRFFSPRSDMADICREAASAGADTCPVEVAYRITEGPRVRVRDIIVRGLEETRTSVVEGEIVLRPGDILSDRAMTRTRDNLVRLGVFDRVVIRPLDQERPAAVKDVLVELRERDNLSLELGVGASTEEGLRAFAAFADRNLFGTALRLQTNAKVNLWAEPLLSIYDASLQEQIRRFYRPFSVFGTSPITLLELEIGAGVSYPRIFLLPEGFSFGLDVIFVRDFDPAFAEENLRVTLIGAYEGFRPRILGEERPMGLQLRLGFETTQLECNEAIEGREDLCSSGVELGNIGDRTEGANMYVTVGPRLSWDFRDDPLDPEAGVYMEVDGEVARGLDANSPDYLRGEGRIDAYAPAAPRVTFFASLRGGRIFSLEPDAEIPLNRRFFLGGRSTIRGYPEKTLLPQDTPLGPFGLPESTVSAGGVAYVVFKTELRFELVSPVSLAGFFDIGDLWRLSDEGACGASGVGFSTECVARNPDDGSRRLVQRDLAKGGGVGLRVATPIGPLAVDLGFPIDPRDPFVEDWTLHFSVGAY